MGARTSKPRAKSDGLFTEEVDGELLVYDDFQELACRLNPTAAFVWRHCDGTRSVEELTGLLQAEFGDTADEDMVNIALDELVERDLLESGYEKRTAGEARFSRRRFLRRVGIAGLGTTMLPMVYSILVPAPAAASSGFMYQNYYPLEEGSRNSILDWL